MFGELNYRILTMQKLIKIFLALIIVVVAVSGCKKGAVSSHKSEAQPGYTIYTVKKTAFENTLYFASRIEPLTCRPVTSSVDGIVTQKLFQYGDKIKDKQLLLAVQSIKEQGEYQSALTRYFQSKQDFMRSEQEYNNDTVFFEKGIVAKEVYDNSRRSYLTSRLNLLQAEAAFKKFTSTQTETKILEQLAATNISEVEQALQFDKTTRELNVYAPCDGLAVFQATSRDEGKTVNVGDEIKVGQMLLCIAPLEGFSLSIRINEINIQQVFIGQAVKVTLDALPGIALNGSIDNIEAQAKGSEQLPTFAAKIIIPKLTPEAAKLVKIGMSAKAGITIKHSDNLLIPFKAVEHYLDQSKVKVIDPNTQQTKSVIVETGETTQDNVEILSGLKEGDQVLVPN